MLHQVLAHLAAGVAGLAVAVNDHGLLVVLKCQDVLGEQRIEFLFVEQQGSRDVALVVELAQARVDPQHVAVPALAHVGQRHLVIPQGVVLLVPHRGTRVQEVRGHRRHGGQHEKK